MPEAVVTVQHLPLRRVAARFCVAAGSSEADAKIVADHLVDANLTGHDSHGVGMLPQYVDQVSAGLLDPRAHAKIEDAAPSMLAVDGQRGWGQVVAREATEAGIARARQTGIALVALRNAAHIGRIGTYGEFAAAAGMVSLHFVNVVGHRGLVAPFRGSDARFSTNPVCITVPASKGKPAIILDFATSKQAMGKIRVAMNRNQTLPDGVIIDPKGKPSNDPKIMWTDPRGAILPFGDHKGYGLAFICELLAGCVTGGGSTSTVEMKPHNITNNMLSIFFDPKRLPGGPRLEEEVAAAIDYVKASPPANPEEEVLVAGEPELMKRKERSEKGVPIERATWDEMLLAAQKLQLRPAEIESLAK